MAISDAFRGTAFRRAILPAAAETAFVLALLLIGGEVLARIVLAASGEVVVHLAERGPPCARNIFATLEMAFNGPIVGNTIAILSALAIVQVPALERTILSAALAIHESPVIALAPILLELLGRAVTLTAITLRSIPSFFSTMIHRMVGTRLTLGDLIEVLGTLNASR